MIAIDTFIYIDILMRSMLRVYGNDVTLHP